MFAVNGQVGFAWLRAAASVESRRQVTTFARQPYINQVLKELGGERGIKRNGRVSIHSPFKLFLLEESLQIQESRLKREMLKLQRALHPDKFYEKDKLSRDVSDQLSALVNEAYETLRHPYKRALHLLGLKLGKSTDDIVKDLDKLKVEPEFLSRMMDVREIIDQTRDAVTLNRLALNIEIELNDILASLQNDFDVGDYDKVLDKLGKLKFLANCHVPLMSRLEGFSNF